MQCLTWSSTNVKDCRQYLATCLLQNSCPSAHSLLIERIVDQLPSTTGTIDNNIVDQRPVNDADSGSQSSSCLEEGDPITQSYNMLHPLYVYHPINDLTPNSIDGDTYPDLRQLEVTSDERLEIANICRHFSENTVL